MTCCGYKLLAHHLGVQHRLQVGSIVLGAPRGQPEDGCPHTTTQQGMQDLWRPSCGRLAQTTSNWRSARFVSLADNPCQGGETGALTDRFNRRDPSCDTDVLSRRSDRRGGRQAAEAQQKERSPHRRRLGCGNRQSAWDAASSLLQRAVSTACSPQDFYLYMERNECDERAGAPDSRAGEQNRSAESAVTLIGDPPPVLACMDLHLILHISISTPSYSAFSY